MWMLLAVLLTLALPRPSAPPGALRSGTICVAHAAGVIDTVVRSIRISTQAGLRVAGRYVAGHADGPFVERLPPVIRVRVARLRWWISRHLPPTPRHITVTAARPLSIPESE